MNTKEYITKLLSEKKQLTNEDYTVCRALIDCMSDDELEQLQLNELFDWRLMNYIEKNFYGNIALPEKSEHNKDWRYYFRNLQNRTKGEVCRSREKLHDMFPYMEWKNQLTLLHYSVCSEQKSDRLWALKQIRDNWSLIADCPKKQLQEWISIIENTWNTFHDKEAAFVVLRHLPKSIVEAHAEKLSEIVKYKNVALSLGENPEYDIEQNRLTGEEYLYVMAKLSRQVSLDDARNCLANVLMRVANEKHCYYTHLSSSMSLMSDERVSLCIWSLGKLHLADLVLDFYSRDNEIKSSLKCDVSDDESLRFKQWESVCNSIRSVFANYFNEYKSKMNRANPSLKLLVDTFQLDFAN